MKFKYYHFALIYFVVVIILDMIGWLIKAIPSEEWHQDIMIVTAFLGLISYLDN